MTVFGIAYSDLGKRTVQDICSVSFGIHPTVNNLSGSFLTHRNVFAGSSIIIVNDIKKSILTN